MLITQLNFKNYIYIIISEYVKLLIIFYLHILIIRHLLKANASELSAFPCFQLKLNVSISFPFSSQMQNASRPTRHRLELF